MGGGGCTPPPQLEYVYMHTDVWRLVPLSVFLHLSVDVRWLAPFSIDGWWIYSPPLTLRLYMCIQMCGG